MTVEIILVRPGDDADIPTDWFDLGGATISSAVYTLPAGVGLSKNGESGSGSQTVVRLVVSSNATLGIYQIPIAATLNNGRVIDGSLTVRVSRAK